MEVTLHNGKAAIQFRHHDKKGDLQNLAIKQFVTNAKDHGVKLGYGSGHLNTGTGESWEDYYILTNDASESPKEHLQWIHDRMVNIHGENPNFDYMIKLRRIIDES